MKAIIMAAGKGTRLCDNEHPLPKVLREAGGHPLLHYVLQSIAFLPNEDITIVVGYMADKVMEAFPGRHFAIQGTDGYGTGYAVKCGIAQAGLNGYQGDIIVLSGDVPLIRSQTIEAMYTLHRNRQAACTLLSCITERQLPFGRIIRNNGQVAAIKEHKDCTPEERRIRELNVGLYIFDAPTLIDALGHISCNNAQHEYYLTDVPPLILSKGKRVEAYITKDDDELWGVNTPEDLAAVEQILNNRKRTV